MSLYANDVNRILIEMQKGDKSQMHELIDLTAVHLLKIARFYINDQSLAEDVISETFGKAWQYISSYDSSKDGYNWLCKIVQNVAFTFNYREKRIYEAEQKFFKNFKPEYVETAFDEIDFFSQLSELSEIDRIIAYKRYCLDESQQSIADQLKISKPAVCKRLKRICKKIRYFYEDQ